MNFWEWLGGFSEVGIFGLLQQRLHSSTFNSWTDLTVLTVVITVVTLKEQV